MLGRGQTRSFVYRKDIRFQQQKKTNNVDAENGAISQYTTLVKQCDGVDDVIQDLCIQSLADEEEHRRDLHLLKSSCCGWPYWSRHCCFADCPSQPP